MKQMIIIISFMFMTALLCAQTGIFGLRFGISSEQADSALKPEGFVKSALYPDVYHRNNDPNSITVELYFEDGKPNLVGWLIAIPIPADLDEFDLEEQYLEELIKLHGDDYEYDDWVFEAYWKLDDHHYVNSAFTDYLDTYLILYGDNRYADYMPY